MDFDLVDRRHDGRCLEQPGEVGGLLFGIAVYRARVLSRWAAALLAVGGLASAGLSLLRDPWFRLLAFPNGIAMIVLGYALWHSTLTQVAEPPTRTGSRARTLNLARDEWHSRGMSRTRLSTTVDAGLLESARKASGKPASALVG